MKEVTVEISHSHRVETEDVQDSTSHPLNKGGLWPGVCTSHFVVCCHFAIRRLSWQRMWKYFVDIFYIY